MNLYLSINRELCVYMHFLFNKSSTFQPVSNLVNTTERLTFLAFRTIQTMMTYRFLTVADLLPSTTCCFCPVPLMDWGKGGTGAGTIEK